MCTLRGCSPAECTLNANGHVWSSIVCSSNVYIRHHACTVRCRLRRLMQRPCAAMCSSTPSYTAPAPPPTAPRCTARARHCMAATAASGRGARSARCGWQWLSTGSSRSELLTCSGGAWVHAHCCCRLAYPHMYFGHTHHMLSYAPLVLFKPTLQFASLH